MPGRIVPSLGVTSTPSITAKKFAAATCGWGGGVEQHNPIVFLQWRRSHEPDEPTPSKAAVAATHCPPPTSNTSTSIQISSSQHTNQPTNLLNVHFVLGVKEQHVVVSFVAGAELRVEYLGIISGSLSTNCVCREGAGTEVSENMKRTGLRSIHIYVERESLQRVSRGSGGSTGAKQGKQTLMCPTPRRAARSCCSVARRWIPGTAPVVLKYGPTGEPNTQKVTSGDGPTPSPAPDPNVIGLM